VAYSGLTGTVPTWNQDTTGNAATATALQTARTIGGVSFDGTANINLPGVNIAGNQNTSGSAAVVTTTINSDVVGTTQAAKTNNTLISTTSFSDRFRSLHDSTTTGSAVIDDRGCLVLLSAGFTIPSGIFQKGDIFTIYNNTSGNLTITQGASLTLRLVASATTGNRTLAQRGLATIVFISGTEAVISGGGLT